MRFSRRFRRWIRTRSSIRFSTWLYTIAYRLTLNFLRRKRALSGDVDFTAFASDAPDGAELVAESEEARRVRDIIWSAVEQLSEPQKAAILLFYRHDQGCQEIAQVLQIPVATVKSHLHRARARLRDLLEPLVAEESSRNRILSEFAGVEGRQRTESDSAFVNAMDWQ